MARTSFLTAFAFAALAACSSNSPSSVGDQDITGGAGEGQICGGFAGTTCAAGLRCTYGSEGMNTGRCVVKDGGAGDAREASAASSSTASSGADEGEQCGGFAGIACRDGLRCRTSGGFDGYGYCE